MSDIKTTDNINVNYLQKMHRWRMAFFGVIILLAGIIIGGASIMILMPEKVIGPSPGPEFESLRMIPPLRRNLGLSEEQAEKIKPVLDSHMQELREIRENARSEIEQTLGQMNAEISSVLTEEQKQRWTGEVERLQRQIRPGRQRRGEGMGRQRRDGERSGYRRGGEGQGMRQGRSQREGMRRGAGPNGSQRVLAEPNVIKDRTPIESNSTNENVE